MNKIIKKQRALGLLFALMLGWIPAVGHAQEVRTFAVTAYYSPLPNQTAYMRGSYEADIRLNGRGTNGADGTPVYVGMLAAPKSYAFGTQIYIPGLGVGTVHDRGGAILAKKDYDRIDVWMGYGDEGLARALNWGYRFVEGQMVSGQTDTLDFSWIATNLPKRLLNQSVQNPDVFEPKVTANDSDDIRELQTALASFDYYHGEIHGTYDDETRRAVIRFQLANQLIDAENGAGAGVYGPKTRAAVKQNLETFNAEVERERTRIEQNLAKMQSGLGVHSSGEEVYWLQQMLWELGYYHGELDGRYNEETVEAVFSFQKARGVLNSDTDAGAGFFGKKTHEALLIAVESHVNRLTAAPIEKSI
ncbi:peptidoglycan-binding protein [Candidatus Peregrinibacteria bacterium]|nr:MAG: peptidoglycan-binding protein [Candidatus Peregrinibacteria bacterium]